MKIELNKKELEAIKLALYLASEWEQSLIEAHTVSTKAIIKKVDGVKHFCGLKYSVPKEWKSEVNIMKRNVMKFKKLLDKLK